MKKASKQMNMGFFSSFTPPGWQAGTDRMNGADWHSGGYYERLAKRTEAACFDFLFFEDTSSVSRMGGSMDIDLKYAISAPKNDPVALITYLSGFVEHLGLVATASTSLYQPFHLARLYSTIDHFSHGHVGWNIVTSSENESAQNFGYDNLPPTNERYARAEEFVDVVNALWSSWDDDAVILDQENNVYTDPSKVHEINHIGDYFKVRGPLNCLPSPQKRPVYFQAGGSDRGRDFAAKNADAIMGLTIGGVKAMKAFREDIHARMKKFGRDPSECKILYMLKIYAGKSSEEFRNTITDRQIFSVMAKHSAHFGVNLMDFDLDKPFPSDVVANGTTSMLDSLKEKGRQGIPLRDAMIDFQWGEKDNKQIGYADDIADHLIEMMEYVGGDGYILSATGDVTEEYLDGIFEVAAKLQERGAMRTSYSGKTLRENLFAL